MSEKNPFDWAERAGKDAAERESALRVKRTAEEAEKAVQQRAKTQQEAYFNKKAGEFILALSNQVQFAVNAFNRGVTNSPKGSLQQALERSADGTQVDAPAPLGRELGFTITKRTFVTSSNDPRLHYPGTLIQTTVELFLGRRILTIFHTHKIGRDDRSTRLQRAKNHNQDDYSIDLEANGQIVVTRNGEVIAENELVVQICTPLFEYVGTSE
jgi:hypothetical protein